MNNKRRRLLLLCCNTHLTDPLCPTCQNNGRIYGTKLCETCGYAITRQCNNCHTKYCNKCTQTPNEDPDLPQLDPAIITLEEDILKIFDESGLATSATIFVDDEPTKVVSCKTFAEEPLANHAM